MTQTVIPAQAGIQGAWLNWVPAFAGLTYHVVAQVRDYHELRQSKFLESLYA